MRYLKIKNIIQDYGLNEEVARQIVKISRSHRVAPGDRLTGVAPRAGHGDDLRRPDADRDRRSRPGGEAAST